MSIEVLYLPQKNLYPQNKFLATPLKRTTFLALGEPFPGLKIKSNVCKTFITITTIQGGPKK